MLEKIEKLPDITHGPSPMKGRSYVENDVRAFVDSDMDCARIHFEGHGLVAVTKRKNELYLIRR